jgi:ribonuclease T2
VLSWSPTHCLSERYDRGGRQCDPNSPDDFVLHGFWPQYAKGWPEDCYTGKRPWVPSAVIGEIRDIMPGKGIVIHEYKTHGTCTGLSPSAYFAAARKAYDQVTIPTAFETPKTQRFLSPEDVEDEFIAANDWLKADMIAVSCRRGNLFDVRICFSDDIQPRACGANFVQKKLCPLRRITVPVP